MAEIVCTIEEFHKYIGPRIRNRIQSITKKEKSRINHLCQICGKKEELQSAHKKENSRKEIIETILKRYVIDERKKLIKLDLFEIEKLILDAHDPIEQSFLFLCQNCHVKYDAGDFDSNIEIKEINISPTLTTSSPKILIDQSNKKTYKLKYKNP